MKPVVYTCNSHSLRAHTSRKLSRFHGAINGCKFWKISRINRTRREVGWIHALDSYPSEGGTLGVFFLFVNQGGRGGWAQRLSIGIRDMLWADATSAIRFNKY